MLILYIFSVLLCLVCAQAALPNDDIYKAFIHLLYLLAPLNIEQMITVCNSNVVQPNISAFYWAH
jgi:hypothetical protein